ncbi:hypothetical protein [Bacteriovorax sp. Seq25_V]|uniref:hypothetical protein n=1 Tax=Bacteriovorax sp. Seq25_V TaxID=1201288 RepID=UPI00038A2D16|nr:hypothetical protein [Bacteriovorax sp. Seq25_V]EQC45300.1 hypothetical protein M900_2318 [Bacteriovorax sp. Seq25_V]
MKKFILGMVIVTAASSAMADRGSIIIGFGDKDRDLKCERTLKDVRRENVMMRRDIQDLQMSNSSLSFEVSSLKSELQQCKFSDDNSDRNQQIKKLRMRLKDTQDQLEGANAQISSMSYIIDSKNQQILDLEARVRDLEDQLNPAPPYFDLAQSVMACRKISNASYASECASSAKKFQVTADTIKGCTKLGDAYYAKECVSEAGKNNAFADQVSACTDIKNDAYAVECVTFAGKGRVSADVVRSCVMTSSNAYYQKDCVAQMGNN